jgi:general secretion pathway protein G
VPSRRAWRTAASTFGRLKGTGAFTLVEILIVLALIATLAGIGIPIYYRSLDKARQTRAIADIRNIALTITTTFIQTGAYPATLAEVNCALNDPWGHPYEYLVLSGSKNNGKARKDKNLVPINTDFDLYSAGPDGKTTSPLTAKISQDDIVRANNGGFVGVASDY